MRPNRQPGVQSDVQQELQRASEHARLLRQRHRRMEVPLHAQAIHADRAQPPRPLPRHESGRRVNCNGGGRRDAPLLESVPEVGQDQETRLSDRELCLCYQMNNKTSAVILGGVWQRASRGPYR